MSSNDRPEPHERVLVLGLDGLSSAFVRSPIVESTMPNLRTLLGTSSTGTLRSTVPPYTAPGWTTITTGVEPDRHGVFSFTDRLGHPVTAASVAVPRVWDHVGAAEGRSVVVNVPLTHPPRDIDGVLVSGMPVPTKTPFTSPPSLADELQASGYIVDIGVREGAREPVGTLERLRVMTQARGRLAVRLARTEPWNLFMAVFVLPDRLGHPWWKYLVPGDRQYETRRGARLRRAATGPLRALDDAIGELIAAMPASTPVVVCSDHGFGPLHAEVFFDVALAQAGIVHDAPVGRLKRSIVALGRSRASLAAPAALRRWTTQRLQGPANHEGRAAWTAPAYERGVRLADPTNEVLRERIVRLLLDLRAPNGDPVFRAVRRRDELFRTELAVDAPDLICEPASEAVDLHEGAHAPRPWVSRDSFGWGTHTSDGVVAVHAASAHAARIDGRAADVTPTVLHLLGLRTDGLDGSSLLGDADGGLRAVSARPVSTSAPSYSEQQEDEVLDHLRSLGYVD